MRSSSASAPYRSSLLGVAALATAFAAGCGGTSSTPTPPVPPPPSNNGVAVSGTAMAGSQPLMGSTVQLYAAGSSGNGSSSLALSASAATDATGSFTVAGGYTCPAPSSQLFLTASDGTPAPRAVNALGNPATRLIVLLGRCDAVSSSAKYIVNEVTTAATVWSLSQFLSTGGNLGASSTNTAGLANAVAIGLSLAGNTTGSSPGPTFPPNGTSPAPRIHSLANAINACVVAPGAACGQLFALTTPSGAAPPANTLDAALNLVRNPGANVSLLFSYSQSSTAFSPSLASAPADWTLPLTFTGAGMNAPGPLGIDSHGNIWVASYFGVLSEFSPTGTPTFASGISGSGLSESYGLAIDPSNNVWITDESSLGVNNNLGAVTVLSPNGQPISGTTGFSSGGLNYPVALAIDPNGTTWVVDYGNSHLTVLNSSGQPVSGASGYFSNLFAFPVAIALDASHNAWVANMSGNSITRVSSDGQQFTSIACCNGAAGMALDAAGNVWVTNYLGDSVSEISAAGTVISSGYTGGGLLHPQGIAVDGAGTVWVANFRGNSISELAGANAAHPGQILSPSAGWAPTPTSLQTFAIAIDSSGNLWVTNFADNSITELVGIATPVRTPLSLLPRLP